MMKSFVSVIVPAFQEEAWIGECLLSVIGQDFGETTCAEIVVVANGCSDATAARARSLAPAAAARGIALHVAELAEGSKALALTAGDRLARGELRVYLDADVICGPNLLRKLAESLAGGTPRYASGRLRIPRTRSWISNCYVRAWAASPFVASGVSGCGLYAVNAAGRARWGEFPALTSDDKFVRLQFAPEERRRVDADYHWPVPEGFANLVRARRRWCEGNVELLRVFPQLRSRDRRPGSDLAWYARLAMVAPVSAAVFAVIFGTGRLLALGAAPSESIEWRRGR